jgi:hypothetical protein
MILKECRVMNMNPSKTLIRYVPGEHVMTSRLLGFQSEVSEG